MKVIISALSLAVVTMMTIVFYPNAQSATGNQSDAAMVLGQTGANQPPRIEIVFALDTTSSMSGFIQAAKEKIWSIAASMASADVAPEIRIGLVAFRDRGDQYITEITDLSSDLDSVYATLMGYRAEGGGDGPESVNQALYDAVHRVSWSQGESVYKAIFLVGDAPPHMDYPDDVKYPVTLRVASSRGISVNAIQSGHAPHTAQVWQHIATLNQGEFFNVAADGDGVSVGTPYDATLAELSRDLDATRLFFGDSAAQEQSAKKSAAAATVHAHASVAARARRAAFNASHSGAKNLLGEQELVDAVTSGRIDLDAVPEAELPATLQTIAPAARGDEIMARAARREALSAEIANLSAERDRYIERELATSGDSSESLDAKMFDAVKRQAGAAGIHLQGAPKY